MEVFTGNLSEGLACLRYEQNTHHILSLTSGACPSTVQNTLFARRSSKQDLRLVYPYLRAFRNQGAFSESIELTVPRKNSTPQAATGCLHSMLEDSARVAEVCALFHSEFLGSSDASAPFPTSASNTEAHHQRTKYLASSLPVHPQTRFLRSLGSSLPFHPLLKGKLLPVVAQACIMHAWSTSKKRRNGHVGCRKESTFSPLSETCMVPVHRYRGSSNDFYTARWVRTAYPTNIDQPHPGAFAGWGCSC